MSLGLKFEVGQSRDVPCCTGPKRSRESQDNTTHRILPFIIFAGEGQINARSHLHTLTADGVHDLHVSCDCSAGDHDGVRLEDV